MRLFFQYLRCVETDLYEKWNYFSVMTWLTWPQRVLFGNVSFYPQQQYRPPSIIFNNPPRWWTSYLFAAILLIPSMILSVIFQTIAFCFPSQRRAYREFWTHAAIYPLIDQAYQGKALSKEQRSNLQSHMSVRANLSEGRDTIAANDSEVTTSQLINALNWMAQMRNTRTFKSKADFQVLADTAKTMTINADAFRLLHHAFEQRWKQFKATCMAKDGYSTSPDEQIDESIDLWRDPDNLKEFSSLMIDSLLCTALFFASIRTTLAQLGRPINSERIISALASQGQHITFNDTCEVSRTDIDLHGDHLFLFDFLRASTPGLYKWVRLHATLDSSDVKSTGGQNTGLGRRSDGTWARFTQTIKEQEYEAGFYRKEEQNLFYLFRKQHNWFNKVVMPQATGINPYKKGNSSNDEFTRIIKSVDDRSSHDFDLDRAPKPAQPF